jgi:hypothetical protein
MAEANDVKYTAKDLYIAFVAGGVFKDTKAGSMDERWKMAVGKALNHVEDENRPANRGTRTADFEQQFNDAKKASESTKTAARS